MPGTLPNEHSWLDSIFTSFSAVLTAMRGQRYDHASELLKLSVYTMRVGESRKGCFEEEERQRMGEGEREEMEKRGVVDRRWILLAQPLAQCYTQRKLQDRKQLRRIICWTTLSGFQIFAPFVPSRFERKEKKRRKGEKVDSKQIGKKERGTASGIAAKTNSKIRKLL